MFAENLAQSLGASQVVTYPQNASREADYRVLVDIQRFESVLGQAVAIDALWTVRRASNRDSKTGRSVAGEPTAGAGHDALVTAHGRALVAVSRDIADAIRAMERMPR